MKRWMRGRHRADGQATLHSSEGIDTGFSSLLTRPGSRGTVLLALFSYASLGLLLQIFPPLLPAVSQEFHVDHATVSLVMTLFLAPMALIALPGGSLVDRYGARRIGALALSLMTAGGLVSIIAPDYTTLVAGRVTSGFGGGLLLVSILKILTNELPRTQHGLAFGFFVAGLPIGTGFSFDLLTPLNHWMGWRGETAVAVVVVITALIAFLHTVKQTERRHFERSNSLGIALRSGSLWKLVGSVVLGYTAVIGFTTWAPTVLVGYARIPLWAASVIASILLLVDIPLGPLWGALSDRLGRRKPFILLAFVIYLLGSIFVPFVAQAGSRIVIPALLVAVAIMGTGCSMFFPVALTIPAKVVPPEYSGAAYGMFFTAQVVGMVLGPLLIGLTLDAMSPYMAFFSVSAITFAGLLASIAIKSD